VEDKGKEGKERGEGGEKGKRREGQREGRAWEGRVNCGNGREVNGEDRGDKMSFATS